MSITRPQWSWGSTLDSDRVAASIRAGTLASRDQLIDDIQTRMRTSDQAMKAYQASTKEMSAENRESFKAAATEVKQREKALYKDIIAAQKATERNWDSIRATLAADYEAYAAAAARIDVAAGVPPLER